MTTVKYISPPLLARDLNREPKRRSKADGDMLPTHRKKQENNEPSSLSQNSVYEIKARFDRDFLPKYGDLWRSMTRKNRTTTDAVAIAVFDSNESLEDKASSGSSSPSLQGGELPRRAINFLEAIKNKETVSISPALHGDNCDCATPIEEFLHLDDQEQTLKSTLYGETGTVSSDTSRFSPKVTNDATELIPRSTQSSRPISDEDTETEIDEDDFVSVYETADEFYDDGSDYEPEIENAILLVQEKEHHVTTRPKRSDGRKKKIESRDDNLIFDLGSMLDEMDGETKTLVNARNRSDDTNATDRIFNLPTLTLSKDGKDSDYGSINHGSQNTYSSPQPVSKRSTRSTNVLFVDTDEDADDEHYTDSDEEDDDNEAEWVPDDDYSLQANPKSNPLPKTSIDKAVPEKQETFETIDLCDSSSFDDSGFVSLEDDDYVWIHQKQNIPSVSSKERGGKTKSKVSFRRNRDRITASTFDEFNQKAFRGDLDKVVVKWSNKLNTTAGLTRLQKVAVDTTPGIPQKRIATIELSTKVVDNAEKLRTTLLHELVHAAVWIFDGVSRPPHGADFKRWAKIAMSKIPDVVVTTTHDYQITYKFNWKCVNHPKCSFQIGRHSKSVDTVRHRCGICKGKLTEVTSDGAPKKQAQPSVYNLFVKQYSKTVREQLMKQTTTVTQADVMKELGRLWREKKVQSSK